MLNTPFSPWPCFTEEEREAVSRVLASNRVNYWTGDEGRKFESEFADWVGVKHAVALSNGTVALELALRALDISVGEEVIVTPRSFFGSASSIVAVGASPVFADVDWNSQNITADTIRAQLTDKTRAVICVHLAGMPCDMEPIQSLAAEHDLKIIEDCAQAHGAEYRGKKIGGIGHVAAWSFCQDKIMTTGGEGGMITTNDDELWSRAWSLKDHGKSWDAVYNRKHPPGFRWLHDSFGTNARMLEMQAVIGRIQLRRMPEWSSRRMENASRLAAACSKHAVVRIPEVPEDCTHAYYRFYVFVRPEQLAAEWDRDRIVEEIVARGVPCYQGACPEIYREKAFIKSGFRQPSRCPTARELGETGMMFLVHPTLTDAEIERSCEVLGEVLALAGK